jgi:hypothetical protein
LPSSAALGAIPNTGSVLPGRNNRFQRIEKERAKDLKLVAVLPQAVEEGRKYLEGVGVQVDDVKQAPLNAIGVAGTPTLLLVDSSGAVARFWQGKVQPDQEAGVLAVLRKDVSQ